MTRIARAALPVVMMLALVPTAAFAQSLVCHPIRRGESATQVARRVTGDGRNTYQTWFQIKNASSRFIPKSQYNRIRAGWLACVIKPAIQNTSNHVEAPDAADLSDAPSGSGVPEALPEPAALASAEAVVAAGDSPQSAASRAPRTIGAVDLTMVWLGAAMVVPWFGWRMLDGYLVRRKTASIVVGHFAHRFVDEFARPLVRYPIAERPVRSRFRRGARRGRFDILLAPGEGRRYPNLSDHKKNVEYDVTRVMHALADDSFVSGAPYTQGEWVVVPFQFKAGPRQSGVTCISSL